MHDNVRSHTARITQQYLNDADIDVLEWTALSPSDENPIEHVWDMLGRTLNELQHALLEKWDLIPQKDIRHLILGMPRRMQAENIVTFPIIHFHLSSLQRNLV
nr:unnamed protein product [Callosobruchus chinensis]